MRTLFRCFASLSISAFVPACSLLFDPRSHRSDGIDGGSADGGPRDAGMVDTGPAISCGDPSMCPVRFWCETMTMGICMPGCDEPRDCSADEVCDDFAHVCVAPMPCTNDTDCAPADYCDDVLNECAECDFDGDRWFDMDAPIRCGVRPALDLLGGGDCDDVDPAVHPFAPPDCNPTTNETCGTGMGVFPDGVFEVGLVAVTDFAATSMPESLHVLTMSSTPASASMLVVYRDPAGVPQFMTASIEDSNIVGTVPAVLVDWQVAGTVLGSQLGVLRIPEGGAFIGSVEAINDPMIAADNFAAEYGMRVDPDGTVGPAEVGMPFRQPLFTFAVPTAVSGLVATYDYTLGAPSSAMMGAILKETDSGGISSDGLYLVGINNSHFERSAAFVPATSGYNGSVSGHAGGLFYGTSRSTVNWWNGGLMDRAFFVMLDSMSTYRSGAASGRDANNAFGVTVSSMGGPDLLAYGIDCSPGDPLATPPTLASCLTNGPHPLTAATSLSGGSGGDPLLAADHIGGRSFMVVGRSQMSMGPMSGLVATLIDFGTGTPTSSSAVLPVGDLSAATDLDLSITITALPPGRGVVTVGFGMTTPELVRYGAFRICSTMGPGT